MTTTRPCIFVSALALGVLAVGSASAQPVVPETREYSRSGELSPGAAAPSIESMMAAIQSGSPETFRATLEYGERVLCMTCVPLLEDKLLSSGEPRVRELSAWWLRRQPFAGPAILKSLKAIVASDADPVRRARAAEALGEFMDAHALPALISAAKTDPIPAVRAAAVRALARVNDPGSGPVIAAALSDADPSVRASAMDVLLLVAGFHDFSGLLPLLADADPTLRTQAARLCGQVRLAGADVVLSAVLAGDSAAGVRKAAAWALGRIGGANAVNALQARKAKESDVFVLSAIDVAQRMKPGTP